MRGLLSLALLLGTAPIVHTWAADIDRLRALETGTRLLQRGGYGEAAEFWKKTAADAQRAGDQRLRAEALIQLADTYRALGHLRLADTAVREALAVPKLDPAMEAGALNLLGNLLQLAGAMEDARKALDSSIEMSAKLGRDDLRSAALNDMGNLLVALDRGDEAAKAYGEAIALAARAGNGAQQARSSLNAARLALRAGRTDQAIARGRDADKALQPLSAMHEKAFGLLSVGELYLRMVEQQARSELLQASFHALQQALGIAESLGDQRLASYALGYTGRLYELEARDAEAVVPTRRAIFLAQQANAPDLLYRWHWQNGRLLRMQGEEDRAIAEYRRALTQLQAIRHDVSASYSGSNLSFRTVVAPLYFELADLLLRQSAKTDASQTERLLLEARDIIEQSKSAELQDYFQDNCVAAQQARVAQISGVGAQTAVVYPIMLKDRLELLVSFEQGIKRVSVPVTADALVEDARAFRVLLEKRTTRQYLPYSQKLYDLLLRPLEPELAARGIDTLVIVPDGALRTIPMSALHDGKDFVIRRYAIATTPGLTLTDPRPLPEHKLNVLLSGLTLPVQGFSSLPNVGTELKSIHELYGGTLLRDREYLLGNVEIELLGKKSYNVVHMASHAQFRSDPKQTFLLTYDGKLTMDVLEKLIAPSRYREQPIELLTLSACQTAVGDDRAALGLAGVAIKAGVRSALASLWFINDQSSTALVSEFYRNLQGQDLTKAKALQQAQLKLIGDGRFRHPGYWAPFLLIGNWL